MFAYAKTLEDIPYMPKERTLEEIKELELKKVQKIEEKYMNRKMSLIEFIMDIHEKAAGKPVNFATILDNYKTPYYYGRKPNSDRKIETSEIYQELINKGKLEFDGRFSYFPGSRKDTSNACEEKIGEPI